MIFRKLYTAGLIWLACTWAAMALVVPACVAVVATVATFRYLFH